MVLVLKNGDRISGLLLSENSERIVLKSPTLGRLKIPRDQITSRENPLAAKVPATAPTNAPPIAQAPAKPAASAPQVAAVPPVPKLTNMVQPTWLQRLAPDFLDPYLTNWHGNVQLGMDLGFGTTDRQTFYGNGSATHSLGRLRNLADLHAAYGFVNRVQSAERVDGSWKLDIDLGTKRRIYVYNQAGAGFDVIRRLDSQFQEGVGLGYKILQRPKLIVSGEAGGQYQLLDYAPVSQIADRHIISVRLGESVTWNLSDRLKVNQKGAFMPNVEDFSDYRMRFELGLSYPLFKRVTLNLNLVDEYDSRPPPGVDANELQIQSTVGITF